MGYLPNQVYGEKKPLSFYAFHVQFGFPLDTLLRLVLQLQQQGGIAAVQRLQFQLLGQGF